MFFQFLLVCLASVAIVQSFTVVPVSVRPSCSRPHVGSSTQLADGSRAEEEVEEMKRDWEALLWNDVEDIDKMKDEDVATEIAEKILKEAIDFAQAKERVEKEHARKAHSELEKALAEESKLAGFVGEAHHDAEDADQIIHTFEDMEIGEDLEKRREMAVSDISHHLEDYVAKRLEKAKTHELRARETEDNAKYNLEELQQQENDLKATLEELKLYTKKRQMEKHE